MKCAAAVLSGLTNKAQARFRGTVITKDKLTTVIRRCGHNAGPTLTRNGAKYPVCRQHDKETTCVVAEFALNYVQAPAEPELPFQRSRSEVITAAAESRAALEAAADNSRVINTIAESIPGVHRLSDLQFVIAGTGSRSLQQADRETKNKAKARVMAEIEASKANHGDKLVIMSGMAEGFDKLLALCAIEAGVRLWCAIPNKGYADYYWARNSLTGTNQQAAFDAIIANAERVVYVREDVYHKQYGLYLNGRHYNFVRNDYMVDRADAFWVWDPTSRGTSDCLASIKAANKPYRVLSG